MEWIQKPNEELSANDCKDKCIIDLPCFGVLCGEWTCPVHYPGCERKGLPRGE